MCGDDVSLVSEAVVDGGSSSSSSIHLMENGPPQPSGSSPPPKPWERAGSSSGPAPFKPPSAGSTSDVVEASGTARPGEIVSTANRNTAVNNSTLARPVPTRPWEQQQTYGSSYGGINTGMNYNSGYGTGTGTYGSYGGGYGSGSTYGSGLYGNSMYRGGYGGLAGGGMYGGGMYNSGYGGSMGVYGMGCMGGMGMGPYGDQDPNNPYGAPPSSTRLLVSFMHVMQGVVTFFGRVAMLIDQNTQAFHMFMSALLQLFDRSGLLYGELARFVLRLLGVKTKANKIHPPGANAPHGPNALPGPHQPRGNQNFIEGPKAAPGAAWNDVWGDNAQ
uniref:Peroxin-13 n=3 Tax=Solanum TaxID=4107 RepID=M1BUM4_SOLTU